MSYKTITIDGVDYELVPIQKSPPKEYEILSYLFNLGGRGVEVEKESVLWAQCVQMKSHILSVKRLGDGIVFAKRDLVRAKSDSYDKTFHISKFEIDYGDYLSHRMIVWSEEQNMPMCDLKILLPPQEKKPLFTTEPMDEKELVCPPQVLVINGVVYNAQKKINQ